MGTLGAALSKMPTLTHKIVLLGEMGVGNTCISIRYYSGKFSVADEPTIGGSFMTKNVWVAEKRKKTSEHEGDFFSQKECKLGSEKFQRLEFLRMEALVENHELTERVAAAVHETDANAGH